MKKLLLLTGLFLGLQALVVAQQYSFTKAYALYVPLAAPVPVTVSGWGNGSYSINIGFPFTFGNQTFTSLGIDSDGFIDFRTDNHESWIDGFYADLQDRNLPGQRSEIGYQLCGSPGNQILKIEWKNAGFAEGIKGEFLHFQIWLYEGSNKFEFHYGPSQIYSQTAIFGNGGGPDIGLVSLFNAATLTVDGLYLQGSGNRPESVTLSNASAYPNLETIPQNGTVYTFTRNLPVHPTVITKEKLAVNPNPVKNILQLEGFKSSSEQVTVTITDALGKEVLRQQYAWPGTLTMNVENLPKGAYFISITNGNQQVGQRIIKL